MRRSRQSRSVAIASLSLCTAVGVVTGCGKSKTVAPSGAGGTVSVGSSAISAGRAVAHPAGKPSDVELAPGTDPALTPFTPVVVRDGNLDIEAIGSQLFVVAAGRVMAVTRDGVLDEQSLDAEPSHDATVRAMTGRWPEDAWLSIQGSEAAPIKHGPVHSLFHYAGGGWKRVPTTRGAVSFYYPHVFPWRAGAALAFERFPDSLWNDSVDRPDARTKAFLDDRTRDARAAKEAFVILGAAPGAAMAAPIVDAQQRVEDFAVTKNGELFALLGKKAELGPLALHRWNADTRTWEPMSVQEKDGRVVTLHAFYTLPSGDVLVEGTIPRRAGEDAGADVSVMYTTTATHCTETVTPNPLPFVARWDGASWAAIAMPSGALTSITSSTAGDLYVVTRAPTQRGRGLEGTIHLQKKGAREWTEVPLPALRFPEDGRNASVVTDAGVVYHQGEPADSAKSWMLAPSRIIVRSDGELWVSASVVAHQRWVYSSGSWGIGSSFRNVLLRSRKGPAVRLEDDPSLWPPNR